jgi:hypothetical protein
MLPTKASDWLRPSVLVLVGANLFPVYAVLFAGWTVFAVLLLYWLENVVVGCFNVLRMVLAAGGRGSNAPARTFVILFFMVHYGGFAAVHGLFVIVVFGYAFQQGEGGPPAESLGQVIGQIADLLRQASVGYALLALVASHGFSFVWNYLCGGEYRRLSPDELLIRPYARVVILHVAIIFGALLIGLFRTPVAALVVLVVLKIGLDVAAHLREHAGMEALLGED